ncbi:MAG: transporter substrate-binding domain-containing protein, partial [Clostridiales bacterium]|nr:transporter substrate-binding domain-containing protein [Clostridiales bacterium]
MVTNAAFPPYEMTDDAGNIIGIDPEIAQAIADKLGLELVIDNIDFDAALLSVQENRSDVMLAGLSYREDRDLVMDFTDKYATGVQVII